VLPTVILHNAVSLDGRITGFMPDIELFYRLAGRWKEDATLVGSGTALSPMEEIPPELPADISPPQERPDDSHPLLVVADSRGRVHTWHYLRKQPYWRDWIALCAGSTSKDHLEYLERRSITHLVTGDEQVDLREALETLNTRFGVNVVRVDSGGTLNGALLRAGLVHELSLLVHPQLVGGTTAPPFFFAPELEGSHMTISCRLKHLERMSESTLWLVYEVAKGE
jgi:2,5-diamino-6-(ribosylamino)-4(3H)-pyrimidinone 5'-phosphate reductase